MADDNKTYEVCPHCEEEVKLPNTLGVFRCPTCGKWIVTCSMCLPDEIDCNGCVLCKHADYLNKMEEEEKKDMTKLMYEFGERHGFGATGFPLDHITRWLNERIPDEKVRINLPYYGFNVRGKVSDVHRDVHGVMPMTYLSGHKDECVKVEDTTTLYYENVLANRRGIFLPFLSECDVYYITDYTEDDGMLTINLKKGPSWREYL